MRRSILYKQAAPGFKNNLAEGLILIQATRSGTPPQKGGGPHTAGPASFECRGPRFEKSRRPSQHRRYHPNH
ncbi:hypothetical protein NITGR_190075 [Nitrospina gracilis 3/211]|uniref:Uncharacterized protein n=1 Tax=Nitrospina gracilis (strain 3/211) TaxID=1266370 RepID=M1YHK4_NITG3|nr:hypothetical protein NITGR_190075 [Nitrospina gracilis 3/211]